MASNEAEQLLQEIGQLLAEDKYYPLDGTLLYARLDHNMVDWSIFKERGNHVLYRWPKPARLAYALLELWEVEKPKDRWAEIEYVIRNGRFDATYTYPDDIDAEEDPFEQRDRVVARHFGKKPIVYPPMPLDDDVPAYEL